MALIHAPPKTAKALRPRFPRPRFPRQASIKPVDGIEHAGFTASRQIDNGKGGMKGDDKRGMKVETSGIEPPTSWLQTRRAPN